MREEISCFRIEDTDQERYVEGAVDIIYRTLEKTGLIHDEGPDKDGGCGPYVQSERQADRHLSEVCKAAGGAGKTHTTASATKKDWNTSETVGC